MIHQRFVILFFLFFKGISKTLTMATHESQTTDDVSSQPLMNIQIANYQVQGDESVYP